MNECGIQHASTLWLVIIQLCYLALPLRVAYHTRWRELDRDKAVAVYAVMIVFVFCGMAGYSTTLLPMEYWDIREGIHIGLVIASVALHVLGAPGILADAMLKNNKHYSRKFHPLER